MSIFDLFRRSAKPENDPVFYNGRKCDIVLTDGHGYKNIKITDNDGEFFSFTYDAYSTGISSAKVEYRKYMTLRKSCVKEIRDVPVFVKVWFLKKHQDQYWRKPRWHMFRIEMDLNDIIMNGDELDHYTSEEAVKEAAFMKIALGEIKPSDDYLAYQDNSTWLTLMDNGAVKGNGAEEYLKFVDEHQTQITKELKMKEIENEGK